MKIIQRKKTPLKWRLRNARNRLENKHGIYENEVYNIYKRLYTKAFNKYLEKHELYKKYFDILDNISISKNTKTIYDKSKKKLLLKMHLL